MLKRLLDKTIPSFSVLGEPWALRGETVRDVLRWLWENIYQIGVRADHDHIFLLAAGIAFNIAIALVPTLLILLFVLGYILEPDQVAQSLSTYLMDLLPNSNAAQQAVLIENIRTQVSPIIENRGVAGVLGFIGLLWSSSALAASIRVGINNIMRCREERFFLIYKLFDMLTILLIGLLVFVSVIAGPVLQVLSTFRENEYLRNLDWLFSFGINVAIAVVICFVIFRFTPYQKQRYTIIIVGTAVSAGLWMLARYVFSIYVQEFTTFSRVYGVYAVLASAAFWIYYTALVFLIGAEVAYQVKQSTWNARRTFHRIALEREGRKKGEGREKEGRRKGEERKGEREKV